MKRQAPFATAPIAPAGGLTFHNQLHFGHRYQAALDGVFRAAFRSLPGPWDVSARAVGRAWFRIDVVAPDGASWSLSVPVHEGPRAEDLADTIRAACVRHCRLRPKNARFRASKPGGVAAGTHDAAPTPPTAAEGTSQ